MTSAVRAESDTDQTDLPDLLRAGAKLGVFQAIAVVVFSLVSRNLDGVLKTVLEAVIVAVGILIVSFLPGVWTRARSIEGIAGAAGIGLFAAAVYLVLDVSLLQRMHMYTNRWLEIGGGSNWWYHPVWWMTGTYLPWMGAFILANQRAKQDVPSLVGAVVPVAALAVVIAAGAVLLHFPGAVWSVGTFAVATLPALALAAVITSRGAQST